jgi:diketogulonate reductase-like aldo/keto reductase
LRILKKEGKIGLIGLTNTDAAHLQLLLDSGFPIATNQVSTNVIDRRLTRGRLNELCTERNVGILAYGTLLGGFISEKWLGQPEPVALEDLNWSLRKYLRFIHAAGGWQIFQGVLQALQVVAQRHHVEIPAIATRYVLDIPSVKAVIVGSRLSADSERYIERNMQVFQVRLTKEDIDVIHKAQEPLRDIPGDCGDEYRRAPFLTTTGDTSQHIKPLGNLNGVREAIAAGKRVELSSGSKWEPIAVSSSHNTTSHVGSPSYSQALRVTVVPFGRET